MVEIHGNETDVIYVLDGAATFVTGGTAQNLKSDNPLQPRGTDIQGGESHHLVKGDVIVVPCGTAPLVQGSSSLGELFRRESGQALALTVEKPGAHDRPS